MKTVPAVRLADTTDAAALPDLPEEIALAMTDIAGAAREGLLAMSVAAGMAVMAAMFEAEIAEVCGPTGKHDANRAAVRTGKAAVRSRWVAGESRWIGRGHAPWTGMRCRWPATPTSPPRTCSPRW